MAEVILMPKLSDTMEEGVIARWAKKEGDTVKEGELLAEIETDKATMEYESPNQGVVLKIMAQPGKKIAIKEPICVIGQKGESADVAKPAAATEKTPTKSAVSQVSQVSKTNSKTVSETKNENRSGGPERVRSSPLARKVAAEKGVNLSLVQGSGPGGRVILKDLAEGGGASPAGRGQMPSMPVFATGAPREDQLIPTSMMRQTIAKRLHAAKNDAPHFYLTVSADMTAVNRWREKLNAANEKEKNNIKVSVNDIVILACAKALRKHPQVNSSWEGDNIRVWGNINVAMAVALPTGLITPVVRNCDSLGILQIAQMTKALAARAKGGELKPEDYSGGSFTVSNLGMLGIEEFTAIINPPQSAILAVGTTLATPWVVKDQVVVQPRMKMTMSCDHRVVDGALGAQYLQTLVAYLEDPLMMLA